MNECREKERNLVTGDHHYPIGFPSSFMWGYVCLRQPQLESLLYLL